MNLPLLKKRLALFGLNLLLISTGLVMYAKFSAPAPPRIPAPLPLPSPNGFDVYLAAADALVPARPPVDQVNDIQRLTPQQAAVQYSPQRRRAWIASNAVAWQKMAQAKTLPCRAPTMRDGATKPMFPGWAKLRELSRSQYIRAKDAKASGQWGEATTLGLDNLEMGLNIEHGTNLVGSLFGMAIQAIALYSLEDTPARLDAAQAKSATRRLETLLDKTQSFSQTLTEEKWTVQTSINNYKNTGPKSGFEAVGALFLPQAIVELEEMMDKFVAEADKPIGAQVPVAQPQGMLSAYTNIFYPTTQKSFFNDARRKANERLLLIRLALRAYYMEHGNYPTQLSELSPAYLKKIPVDPFGKGEALRYLASGNSYTAWSIGPDGLDDKGTSIPIKPGRTRAFADTDSKGDIVVKP